MLVSHLLLIILFVFRFLLRHKRQNGAPQATPPVNQPMDPFTGCTYKCDQISKEFIPSELALAGRDSRRANGGTRLPEHYHRQQVLPLEKSKFGGPNFLIWGGCSGPIPNSLIIILSKFNGRPYI